MNKKQMAELSAAQQAIDQLNSKTMDGWDIRVAEARPRQSRDKRSPWV